MSFSGSDAYQNRLRTARMYVSHFLLVFNMCVKRGEMKPSDRTYYSMPETMSELPDLSSEVSVLQWCENVIRGERTRMSYGGVPIYNPTVAKLALISFGLIWLLGFLIFSSSDFGGYGIGTAAAICVGCVAGSLLGGGKKRGRRRRAGKKPNARRRKK